MLISLKLGKVVMLKNVIFLLLLLKMCFVFGQQKTIVIDPGHGGMDSGAIGVNGFKEKDVVLEVAKEIIRLNKTIFDGQLDIYLTRYRDTLVSLSDRAKLTKAINADVFVSLHCNHSVNPNTKGIEVYVYNRKNSFSRLSIWLGYGLQKGLSEKLGFKSRGVKFANFQVLRDAGEYSAVLVEMGFITHTSEADYYLKSENIRAMALAILMGLYNYFNIGF